MWAYGLPGPRSYESLQEEVEVEMMAKSFELKLDSVWMQAQETPQIGCQPALQSFDWPRCGCKCSRGSVQLTKKRSVGH